jgi:hypothetical protein
MVRVEALRRQLYAITFRAACPETHKDDVQPFENTLLFTIAFPKRGLLGKVASLVHHGAVVPLP